MSLLNEPSVVAFQLIALDQDVADTVIRCKIFWSKSNLHVPCKCFFSVVVFLGHTTQIIIGFIDALAQRDSLEQIRSRGFGVGNFVVN